MKTKVKTILFYTKYSRLGASSRLRSYQYFPFLKDNGFDVKVSPLFNDDYLNALHRGTVPRIIVLQSYLKRFFTLFKIAKYDCVVIEYELFPYFPAFVEKLLRIFGVRYMVDYDDAIFHNYDLHPSKLIRKVLGNKIKKVMKYSSAVTVGNSYLHQYAKNAGASRIMELPTVVDINRYHTKQYSLNESDSLIVGWIGTFSTFKYVKNILPLLENVADKYPLQLRIIGVEEKLETSLNINFIPWTENSEAENIRTFDIGIMPLEDTLWEKGKCGYKLIQYMASGIPVIASAIGANNQIVQEGQNGYLVFKDSEWESAIFRFIEDRRTLAVMGKTGRELAEKYYSLQAVQKKLISLVNDISV